MDGGSPPLPFPHLRPVALHHCLPHTWKGGLAQRQRFCSQGTLGSVLSSLLYMPWSLLRAPLLGKAQATPCPVQVPVCSSRHLALHLHQVGVRDGDVRWVERGGVRAKLVWRGSVRPGSAGGPRRSRGPLLTVLLLQSGPALPLP